MSLNSPTAPLEDCADARPQLQKHMLEDKLNDKILHRPAPEALIKDGVLREDPRTAEQKYEEAIEDEYAKREGGA